MIWNRNEFFKEFFKNILDFVGAYLPEGQSEVPTFIEDVQCPESFSSDDLRRAVAAVMEYLTRVVPENVKLFHTGSQTISGPREIVRLLLTFDTFASGQCPTTLTALVDHTESTLNFGHYATCNICMFRFLGVVLSAFLETLSSGTFEDRLRPRKARYDEVVSDLRHAAATAD